MYQMTLGENNKHTLTYVAKAHSKIPTQQSIISIMGAATLHIYQTLPTLKLPWDTPPCLSFFLMTAHQNPHNLILLQFTDQTIAFTILPTARSFFFFTFLEIAYHQTLKSPVNLVYYLYSIHICSFTLFSDKLLVLCIIVFNTAMVLLIVS